MSFEVFYEGVLITREVVFSRGSIYYFTGLPCKYGHIDKREVCSGQCVRCKRLRTERYREQGKVQRQVKSTPDVGRLFELFDFDFDNGIIIYKYRPYTCFKNRQAYKAYNTKFLGKQAGSLQRSTGYREIRIDGELFREHRVLWKAFYKEEAPEVIDHINGTKDDNRITNLRSATYQENSANRVGSRNSSSVYKGVAFTKGRWRSIVSKDGGDVLISESFDDEISAAKFYDEKAKILYGEFAKLNFNKEE